MTVRLLLVMTLWLPVTMGGSYLVVQRGDRRLVRSYTSPEPVKAVDRPDVGVSAAVRRASVDLVEYWPFPPPWGSSSTPTATPRPTSHRILPPRWRSSPNGFGSRWSRWRATQARDAAAVLPDDLRFGPSSTASTTRVAPRIRPARRVITDLEEKRRILDYLRSGAVVQAHAGGAPETFDPTRGEVVPASTLTAGTWVWQEGMVYYLDTYGLASEPEYGSSPAAGYQCPEVPQSRQSSLGVR
ncbi:hypothetical protein DFJ64_0547 [Thermasporomyces composti]|uniref:Uncharacterized protein n=1 Tax=Thermasporomyces composti TaxID=696763 RepID=A0A3D9V817_THECX|nr:hypothetical protein DFJ64_0547 [Thermasporomyces composti]